MPFTPSHAAAALPFIRTPLPIAAVVLGSVAPDLPYYVPVGVPRELTHSPIGAVTADPVIALAALALWWVVFRAPVVDFAPAPIRERMPARAPLGPGASRVILGLLLALGGALVGIATHLAWDWFTHPAGFVDVVPLWRERIGPLEIYRWLQHLSTVAGLAILAIWLVRWMRRTPRTARASALPDRMRIAAWIAVAATWLLLAGGVAIAGLLGGETLVTPALAFRVAVISIGGAGAVAVLSCLGWHIAGTARASR